VKTHDVIVVGAGPAGATAALRLAQKGMKVILLERGAVPGEKNMFGGMLPYCPIVEELLPRGQADLVPSFRGLGRFFYLRVQEF
jgi:flavin-dependent dehydrogenase